VEWQSNPYFDLFRTTKELLDEDFRTTVLRQHQVTAANVAANSVPITTNYGIDAAGTFTAFNTTQDPNKNTNIFVQFNAGDNTIGLDPANPTVAGDVVELTFSGTAPVFVVRPDEMTVVSDIPSVIVTVGAAKAVAGRSSGRLADFKRGTSTQLIRIRNTPVYRQCNIRVEAWARSAREAIFSIQNLEGILNRGFQSIATGETFSVAITSPSTVVDYGDQSYYSGLMEFDVYYFDHSESYEEVFAIQTLVQSYGNFNSTFSNTTVNSIGVVHETV
jgi:alpha-tubulin suppressor-like RCC1 family protein